MTALQQTIKDDLKEAMKARQEVRMGALRMLMSSLLNAEKEKQRELGEEEIQSLIATEAKKRRESVETYEKAGRPELAEKEKEELDVFLKYLPEQLSEDVIRTLVKEAVADTQASSAQDMGKVMAALMPKVKGRADGALVGRIVKEALA
ncbi:MAG: GatB/YqeY domain-containing protein [bacterium]|nr:GatB/YqeY domain-containing protein [bacterium]